MEPLELDQFGLCPIERAFEDRREDESCADGGRIEVRVGIAQPAAPGVRRRLDAEDLLPIRPGAGGVARLQGHFAQGHQGVVSPTAGEGLADDGHQRPAIVPGDALVVPLPRGRIDPRPIQRQRLRRQARRVSQMAVVADRDEPPLGHGPELLAGVFHHLAQGLDRLVPLPIGEERLDPLQLGRHFALGPIDLHRIGQFIPAVRPELAELGDRGAGRVRRRRSKAPSTHRKGNGRQIGMTWGFRTFQDDDREKGSRKGAEAQRRRPRPG